MHRIINKYFYKNKEKAVDYETNALGLVKINGLELEHIEYQTDKICIEAVEQNPFALQFVKNKSLDICFRAISKNGFAIKFVDKHKTWLYTRAIDTILKTHKFIPEDLIDESLIPMLFIHNYTLVKNIKNQTPYICRIAIEVSIESLSYINDQTDDICYFALQRSHSAILYINNKKEEYYDFIFNNLYEYDVKNYQLLLHFINNPPIVNKFITHKHVIRCITKALDDNNKNNVTNDILLLSILRLLCNKTNENKILVEQNTKLLHENKIIKESLECYPESDFIKTLADDFYQKVNKIEQCNND